MCRYLYDFVFFEAVFSYLHRFVTICFNLQLFAAICNYSMLYKFVMCFLNVWHVIWMYDVTYEGIVCDIHVWYAMWCIVVGCAVVEHSLWAHVWPGPRADPRAGPGPGLFAVYGRPQKEPPPRKKQHTIYLDMCKFTCFRHLSWNFANMAFPEQMTITTRTAANFCTKRRAVQPPRFFLFLWWLLES